MKRLHRPDLYCWSRFDEARDLDFHGFAWIRPGGNLLIDPLPMTPHDLAHLEALGGAATVVITNSDHVRGAGELAARFGAVLHGPAGERGSFPLACARWLADGDEVVSGLTALALEGSKTPGELALVLEDTTLVCGDLVRGHQGGALNTLPRKKLADPARAAAAIARLAALPRIEAVLVGDGWPVFRDGQKLLVELSATLSKPT
jgi:glyoxylase-like metal-dependent hydrolase (beta-lactamase superfamily II)